MECNYDGGDCCVDPVLTQYCSECQCIDGWSTLDPGTTESPTNGTTSSPGIIKIENYERIKIYIFELHPFSLYISSLDW